MKSALKLLLGVGIAGVFLWLSLKQVQWSELTGLLRTLSWGWLLPFTIISLTSHFARAYRWKLLLEAEEGKKVHALTLFTGLMYGYVANIAIPRLGEVMRSVYVTLREPVHMPKVIGTVVLERLLDVVFLLLSIAIFFFLMLRDRTVLAGIVGDEGVQRLEFLFSGTFWFVALFTLIGGFFAVRVAYSFFASHDYPEGTWKHRFSAMAHQFASGLVSIRSTGRPALFWTLSAVMWFGYTAMSLVPFWAFPEATHPDNLFHAAFAIAVVGSLGFAIPSPSGLGTYHYFVSQTLVGLYAFTMNDALAYALINHTANLLVMLLAAPVLLVWNRIRIG